MHVEELLKREQEDQEQKPNEPALQQDRAQNAMDLRFIVIDTVTVLFKGILSGVTAEGRPQYQKYILPRNPADEPSPRSPGYCQATQRCRPSCISSAPSPTLSPAQSFSPTP